MSYLSCLVGKSIISMDIALDRHALRFNVSDADPVTVLTEGECCSYTYISSIRGQTAMVTVIGTDDQVLEVNKETEQGSCDRYRTRLFLEDGSVLFVDYKNISNGYYGGGLSVMGIDPYYGGVFEQNQSTLEWDTLPASCNKRFRMDSK